MSQARILRLQIEKGEAGLFHATCPEMKELFVSGETVGEIEDAAPAIVQAICHANGESVFVIKAIGDASFDAPPLVVIPSSQLQQLNA